MAKVTKLSHDRLLEALDYDPDTGAFVWKVRPSNRIHVGDRAGVVGTNRHRFISLDGEKLQASRLAWFYIHGVWPHGDIKQSNGDHDDCSIGNLRDVDRITAARERGSVSTNSTGYKGVSPSTFGRFQASLTWNYQQISLGANFATAEKASTIYQDAERRLIAALTDDDRSVVVAALKLERRQRAVWGNLLDHAGAVDWGSFEEFAASVTDIPQRRYAMAPIDAAKPIGPGNYTWATQGNDISSSVDRVAYNRANRKANLNHHRGKDFLKKYGIDFAEYQRMLNEQNGVCACCERPESRLTDAGDLRMLSVDHNHTTKAVRGLLCSNCNLVLGYACDDVTVLQKAIGYLRKHAGVDTVLPFEPTRHDRDWLMVATPGFKE